MLLKKELLALAAQGLQHGFNQEPKDSKRQQLEKP